MGMIVSESIEVVQKKAFTAICADIPGGGFVVKDDFTQPIIEEGTPVGKDTNGKYRIIKSAELTAAATNEATTYTVKKGHNFVVGDIIALKTAGKAYAITTITTNESDPNSDDITVGTSLALAAVKGDALIQAKAAGASGSALKYSPIGLISKSYAVENNTAVQIVTMGQIRKDRMPAIGKIADEIKFINFI